MAHLPRHGSGVSLFPAYSALVFPSCSPSLTVKGLLDGGRLRGNFWDGRSLPGRPAHMIARLPATSNMPICAPGHTTEANHSWVSDRLRKNTRPTSPGATLEAMHTPGRYTGHQYFVNNSVNVSSTLCQQRHVYIAQKLRDYLCMPYTIDLLQCLLQSQR